MFVRKNDTFESERCCVSSADDLAVKQIETSARTKLADMRAALANESDRREAFIKGDVDLGSLVDASGSKRITTRSPAK